MGHLSKACWMTGVVVTKVSWRCHPNHRALHEAQLALRLTFSLLFSMRRSAGAHRAVHREGCSDRTGAGAHYSGIVVNWGHQEPQLAAEAIVGSAGAMAEIDIRQQKVAEKLLGPCSALSCKQWHPQRFCCTACCTCAKSCSYFRHYRRITQSGSHPCFKEARQVLFLRVRRVDPGMLMRSWPSGAGGFQCMPTNILLVSIEIQWQEGIWRLTVTVY